MFSKKMKKRGKRCDEEGEVVGYISRDKNKGNKHVSLKISRNCGSPVTKMRSHPFLPFLRRFSFRFLGCTSPDILRRTLSRVSLIVAKNLNFQTSNVHRTTLQKFDSRIVDRRCRARDILYNLFDVTRITSALRVPPIAVLYRFYNRVKAMAHTKT